MKEKGLRRDEKKKNGEGRDQKTLKRSCKEPIQDTKPNRKLNNKQKSTSLSYLHSVQYVEKKTLHVDIQMNCILKHFRNNA